MLPFFLELYHSLLLDLRLSREQILRREGTRMFMRIFRSRFVLMIVIFGCDEITIIIIGIAK